MNIQEVNSAIMFNTWTNAELASMIDAVKFARKVLTERAKRAITLGSTVEFTSTKTGMIHRGTVEKIAIKYVTVNTGTGAGRWRVPANMLTVV